MDHTVLPANYTLPASTSKAFTRWRIPRLRLRTSNCSLLLIYLPRKDERLSQPGWLTCSGWFTHISGHPSAAGRAQDRESSPVRDRRSTTVPRNQPVRDSVTQKTVLYWYISNFHMLVMTKTVLYIVQKMSKPDCEIYRE